MQSLQVGFPRSGGHQLSARLEMPADEPAAFALFAHCFACGQGFAGGRESLPGPGRARYRGAPV